jgi:hypothetical protein
VTDALCHTKQLEATAMDDTYPGEVVADSEGEEDALILQMDFDGLFDYLWHSHSNRSHSAINPS